MTQDFFGQTDNSTDAVVSDNTNIGNTGEAITDQNSMTSNDNGNESSATALGDTGQSSPEVELKTILPPETEVGVEILNKIAQWVVPVPFGKYVADKLKDPDYYVLSIEALQQVARDHDLDFGMKNDLPYVFNGQYWQQIDRVVLRHFLEVVGLKQEIPNTIAKKHQFVNNLEKQFTSSVRLPIPPDDLPKINLQNGTLHFTPSGVELKPFNRLDCLTYQLHYAFDTSATAPMFKEFFDRVLPDVALQKLVFQYLAYVFLPHLNLEKIALFYGSGANGKSALLDIFTGLVGKEQVCQYSLEGITKQEYQRAEIAGYLLNISTEISKSMKLDLFKKIASREPLPCRHIQRKPFIAKRYATSIFAANELPADIEQTPAFFRRLLIIPFDVSIPKEEQDTDLAQKIVASELSGVLNYLVEGVNTLVDTGQFAIPESVQEIVKEFRMESDNVLEFMEDNRFRPATEEFEVLRELYDAYRVQCTRDNTKAVNKNVFSRRLRGIGYTVAKQGHNNRTVVYASRED